MQHDNQAHKGNDSNNRNEKEMPSVSPSSIDSKNESADKDTPTATERVKPRAGDGLHNEGTNVDYTRER